MTEWSDAEISRRLALAIGWPDFMVWEDASFVWVAEGTGTYGRLFDYRDPAVIWPIAERFDCFPFVWNTSGPRLWSAMGPGMDSSTYADTAAKAVALAVIKSKGQ